MELSNYTHTTWLVIVIDVERLCDFSMGNLFPKLFTVISNQKLEKNVHKNDVRWFSITLFEEECLYYR